MVGFNKVARAAGRTRYSTTSICACMPASAYATRTQVARLAREHGRLSGQREAAETAWIENAELLDAAGADADARVAT